MAVDLNNVTEATLNQDGQIILTGEDGHGVFISLLVLAIHFIVSLTKVIF